MEVLQSILSEPFALPWQSDFIGHTVEVCGLYDARKVYEVRILSWDEPHGKKTSQTDQRRSH